MIRRATDMDIPSGAGDESLIRICSLKSAYGCDASFIQFFTDEKDGYLSVMDGVATLYIPGLTDEWRVFLQMNPDIHTLHCPASIGRALINDGFWQGREGMVMRYESVASIEESEVCTSPYLPDVHALLAVYFPGIASLDYWYPDASHRVRHGGCHIGCIIQNNAVISTAMTVAETPTEAIIGQVATHAAFRRQGLASKCIKSVIFQCKGKTLYILPLNESAAELYRNLGFVECGTWTELQKK